MGETSIAEKRIPRALTHRNDVLKLIAMITMLIDHIGYMYFPNEMLFRTIGRLAFPIFAYQVAVGYSKTSNLKRYVSRLSIFAFMTHIPYSIFSPDLSFNPIHLNVLFTFIAAIGLLRVYDMGIINIKDFIKNNNYRKLAAGILYLILAIIILISPEVIAFYIKGFSLEYGILGLGLVLLFHIFRENSPAAIISIILLYLLHGYYRVALYNSAYSSSQFWSNLFNFEYVWKELTFNNGLLLLNRYYFNARGMFALIPIYMLQGMDTGSFRLNKYIGYIFYPAHIALLVVIAVIMKLWL